MEFQDPENWSKVGSGAKKELDGLAAKIQKKKEQYNQMMNELYNEISHKVFTVDPFIMPAHGIPRPTDENPMNLFKRQLKVEELSFELAHKRYQKSLSQLISIGRADTLATSHRYILGWTRTLEHAITEQQKIFVKRGNLDPSRSKLGYHLV